MNPVPKNNPVRLKGKKLSALREEVFNRDEGECKDCGRFVPLRDYEGAVDVFTCGHAAHIVSRGKGGSDTLDNLVWKCHDCHILREHCGFNVKGER